jgi:hypothetical protein
MINEENFPVVLFISAPSAGESCLYHVYVNVFCVKFNFGRFYLKILQAYRITRTVFWRGDRGGNSAEDFAPNPQTNIHVLTMMDVDIKNVGI